MSEKQKRRILIEIAFGLVCSVAALLLMKRAGKAQQEA